MSTRQERAEKAERAERAEVRAAEMAAAKKEAAEAEEAAKVRATVKCGTCSEPCSLRGHIKGKDVTPKDAKGFRLFECVRCGLHLEQPACECCGVEVGTFYPSPEDTAEAAAERMELK